jgi:2-polyprenyl-3-methyl-5-hydroxy-6-metoxy-1,4-benzoquinol methylase
MDLADATVEPCCQCPACSARERIFAFEIEDELFGVAGQWRYWSCGECASLYADPRLTPQSIGRAYATYYTHGGLALKPVMRASRIRQVKKQLRQGYLAGRLGYRACPATPFTTRAAPWIPRVGRHAQRQLRRLAQRRGGRLLDVGCGAGTFISEMTALGWRAEGADPDPFVGETARARGLNVHQAGIEDLARFFPANSYDALTLSHVIEHVHDPLGGLEECARVLRRGGTIWLATPNARALGCRIFGRDWRGLEPPRHLAVFSPRALVNLVGRAGFDDVRLHVTHPVAPRMFQESLMIRSRRLNRTQRSMLRFVAPFADLVSGVIPEFGEELVVTGTRE